MKTRSASVLAIMLLLGVSAGLVACSSDDSSNNPTPTPRLDSGTQSTPDGSIPSNDDSGANPVADSGPGVDAALPDAGACVSDASTCNACFTPQQDPVNGCSPAAVNCIPFTKVVPVAP